MPQSQLQTTFLPGPERGAFARAKPDSQPRTCDEIDLALVLEQLQDIATLAENRRLAEGREAIAALLFDFQPLIAARAELLSRTLDLLRRCEASALRQRLLVAVYGDATAEPGAVSLPRAAVHRSRAAQPAEPQLQRSDLVADFTK